MKLYIQRGTEELGNFSLAEITHYLGEGQLLETDFAWHEGLDDWQTVGQIMRQLDEPKPNASEENSSSFGQGRYQYQHLLGEGAMGQVWLAYDKQLERPVAVKLLHQRDAKDHRSLQALKEEVQKCLELTHPNITRIYDLVEPLGEDPFISMEYVSGEDLFEKTKRQPSGRFEWSEIEPYIFTLCDALEYAHKQGMVHRDIKPQNLMITAKGELKLADFGIAAPVTEDERKAIPRAGTPAYWGPQQAQGMTPVPTDDVYSLGALLYHLLVGEAPFIGANEPEITRQHIQDQPVHPQEKLNQLGGKTRIPDYVSELILRCLAKDPESRPRGASEIRAWLSAKGNPVMKRQKRLAMVAAASVTLMLVMGALSIWATMQKKEAVKQKGIAEEKQKEAEIARIGEMKEREKAEVENYANVISLVQSRIDAGLHGQAQEMLWATPKKMRNWEWGRLVFLSQREFLTLAGHRYSVNSVIFSPDDTRLLTGGHDKTARIWDARSGRQLVAFVGHGSPVSSATFSFNGERVVTASWDNTAKIWEAATGKNLMTLKGHSYYLSSANFSPNAERVVTGSWDGTAMIWDAKTGDKLLTLKGHTKEIVSVVYSKDGNRVLSGSLDKTARIWDAETGTEILKFVGHAGEVVSAVFSPDAKRVATGSWDKTAKVWDSETGKELLILTGHGDQINSVAFSPNGDRIVTASSDKSLKVWNAKTGEELHFIKGHGAKIESAVFSNDGMRLATGSDDSTAKVWGADSSSGYITLEYGKEVSSTAFSPDGNRVVTGGWDGGAKIWDTKTGKNLLTLNGHGEHNYVFSVDFSPDGKRVATGSWDGTAKMWDSESGRDLKTFKGHGKEVMAVDISSDGKRIVTGSFDKTAKIWDAETGRELETLAGHSKEVVCAAFSSDDKRIVTGSWDYTAKIWDAETGKELKSLVGHSGNILSVKFSIDGKRVLTGSADTTAKIWDVETGRELLTLKGHRFQVWSAAFSSDGKRIVTGSFDNTAKIWDAETGRELLTLSGHRGNVYAVGFSATGNRLVTGSLDKTAIIWGAVDWNASRGEVERTRINRYQNWLNEQKSDQ